MAGDVVVKFILSYEKGPSKTLEGPFLWALGFEPCGGISKDLVPLSWWPRKWASACDVYVQVGNRLSSVFACIDYEPKAVFKNPSSHATLRATTIRLPNKAASHPVRLPRSLTVPLE